LGFGETTQLDVPGLSTRAASDIVEHGEGVRDLLKALEWGLPGGESAFERCAVGLLLEVVLISW
tara:strand:- start:836 stop:1027 length:192 start_codon:yes stop_codon:yes gene_type:complete